MEFATALDISAGGALIALRRYVAPGSSISIEIPCAAVPAAQFMSPKIQNIEARLIRVSHSADYHLLGLEFAKPLAASSKRVKKKAATGAL